MNYFINEDKKVYSYCLENQTIKLYKDSNLIFSSTTNLKDVSLPVSPLYLKDNLIIFDYDKGIEIINKEKKIFLKILAVYHATIINEYLLVFKQKKLIIINYLTGSIINKFNLSENFEFCNNDEYAFFYRFKNNLTYLYNLKTKQITELKTIIKYNCLFKLMSNNKKIYLFAFSTGKWGITIYDIINNTFAEENFEGDYSALGWQYLDNIDFPIDDSIKMEYKNYGEMICSFYKKYGIFLALYFLNEKQINNLKTSKYHWIYTCYFEYKKIMDKYEIINSDEDLKNIKLELIRISNIFKTHIGNR